MTTATNRTPPLVEVRSHQPAEIAVFLQRRAADEELPATAWDAGPFPVVAGHTWGSSCVASHLDVCAAPGRGVCGVWLSRR